MPVHERLCTWLCVRVCVPPLPPLYRPQSVIYLCMCAWEKRARKKGGGRSSDKSLAVTSSILAVYYFPPSPLTAQRTCTYFPGRYWFVLLFFFPPFSIDIFIYVHINACTCRASRVTLRRRQQSFDAVTAISQSKSSDRLHWQ